MSRTGGIFWELDVGQERKVILNISLKRPIIFPGPNLKFENVTIGECPDVYYQVLIPFINIYNWYFILLHGKRRYQLGIRFEKITFKR